MAQTSWKNKEEDKERTDEWRINTEINPGRTETFSDKKTSSVKEQQLLSILIITSSGMLSFKAAIHDFTMMPKNPNFLKTSYLLIYVSCCL